MRLNPPSRELDVSRPTAMPNVRRSGHLLRRLGFRGLIYGIIVVGAILELTPLLWMLGSSLKPMEELFRVPPTLVPSRLEWQNYRLGWTYLPFSKFFLNTVTIAIFAVTGSLLSASLMAFSFARLRWPGRDIFFVIYLAAMMIPQAATIIPEYIVFRELGFINTFYPLILPSWLAQPYFVFLLRQFFMSIPRDMDDAARIDGCTNFGIYWRIIMPMAKPALGVVAIYGFGGVWNDFFRPLIFLHSQDRQTLALGLQIFNSTGYGSSEKPWNQIMAVSLLITLPLLISFFFLQRMFIQGIVVSGVKG